MIKVLSIYLVLLLVSGFMVLNKIDAAIVSLASHIEVKK